MRRLSQVIALLFAVAVAPALLRANEITYTVNQTEGSFTAIGTVTTDGTIGTLATADIVAWDLTLNASPAIVLQPNNSAVVVIGNSLSATATDLTFDFTSGFNDNVQFNDSSTASWWHVVSQPPSAGYDEIAELGGLGTAQFAFLTGDHVIATGGVATPETPTNSLLMVGLGLLVFLAAMLRRRNAQRLAPATGSVGGSSDAIHVLG